MSGWDWRGWLQMLLDWLAPPNTQPLDGFEPLALGQALPPVPPFSWERDYRRLWHDAPAAFWLRPDPGEVRQLIARHSSRADEVGRLVRRIAAVVEANPERVPPELEDQFYRLIAQLSRALDKADDRSPRGLRVYRWLDQSPEEVLVTPWKCGVMA